MSERIEEIRKNEMHYHQGFEDLEADFNWLLEQAERVESSKRITDNAIEQIDVTQRLNKVLRQQNERYREILLEIKSVPYDASGMSCGVMLSTIESLVNRVLEGSE